MDYEAYIKGKAINTNKVTFHQFDKVMFEQAALDYFKDFADDMVFTQQMNWRHNEIELTIVRKGIKRSQMFAFHDEYELRNLYHRFENLKGQIVCAEETILLEKNKDSVYQKNIDNLDDQTDQLLRNSGLTPYKSR